MPTKPDETLYVGDRLDNDILPASLAGFKTALIRRGPWGVIQQHDPQADQVATMRIGSLAEPPKRQGPACWALTSVEAAPSGKPGNTGDVDRHVVDLDGVNADDVNDGENWTGGFYELYLVLGPVSDDNLDRAVRALWRAAGINGCGVAGVEVSGLVDVEPGAAALLEHGHLRGTLTLPSGNRVVCGGFSSRYEDVDSLDLYLPIGALGRVDSRIGGYPFDEHSGDESLTWRAPLDRWLADVATAVHGEVPFQRALIGFEVEEDADIAADRRYAAVLLSSPEGLAYRPATA